MSKPFAVIDAETDPFLFGRFPEPFVWGFYDGDDYQQFDDTESLARFLRDYDGFVYAHNGGRFDFFFLLPHCDVPQEIMLINGRIAKLELGACKLRDSWNILPVPLSAYQKDKIDYRIFEASERKKPHHKKLIESYLMSDCVYTYNMVRAFRERYGNVLTQASASMQYYKTLTGKSFANSTREYFELFKPYYYGGRVQCFKRGYCKQDFKVYDINSAYPAAMLDKHPSGLDYAEYVPTWESVRDAPHGFYHVRGVVRGAFPWREKAGTKLIYPDDGAARDYYVTGWEVLAALDTGAIDTNDATLIKALVHYETDDFSDYIIPLYNERLAAKAEKNREADLLAKLAMNSLYGKAGSDASGYRKSLLLDVSATPDLMVGGYAHKGKLFDYGGSLDADMVIGERELEPWEQRYYNVATSASITGWVRAFLWRSLCSVRDPLYCDTDSIACVDGAALTVGDRLGMWKHEGDYGAYAIAGRKLYAFFTNEGMNRDFTRRDLLDRDAAGLPDWGKVSSKGTSLSALDIRDLASGYRDKVTYEPAAPMYSAKRGVRFITRDVRMTE